MIKFKKKNPDTKEKLDQWLWLISGKEEKIEMAEKENEEVKKAVRTLEQISADPKEREMYDSIIQEEFLESIARQKMLDMGIEKGREEGEKKKQKEIAKKLKDKKVDMEIIKEATNLTEEEIEKL